MSIGAESRHGRDDDSATGFRCRQRTKEPGRFESTRAGGAPVVRRWENVLVALLNAVHVYVLALRRVHRPMFALRLVRELAGSQRRGQQRTGLIPKTVKCGGRYYRDAYAPGWPSKSYARFIRNELDHRAGRAKGGLEVAIVQITRACPLKCEHCLDGWVHDSAGDRPCEALRDIVIELRALGVPQIHITGGEPLSRRDAVLTVLRAGGRVIDYRLLTSGVGLTAKVAAELKQAGLTGVHLSLDHFEPARHDAFRGRKSVYRWVERAARNASEAGLLVTLSLCATRAFVTRSNLARYAETASALGASFVQILEPKPLGCYADEDVALAPEQVRWLEEFMLSTNRSSASSRRPIVVYPEFRRRQSGCLAAGNRFIYVDAEGLAHACPFCRTSSTSDASVPLVDQLEQLRRQGCPSCA